MIVLIIIIIVIVIVIVIGVRGRSLGLVTIVTGRVNTPSITPI